MHFFKLFVLLAGVLCLGMAQDISPTLPEHTIRGMVSGTSTTFEVTNSDYLNITLTSSVAVKLTINSIPNTIYFNIDSTYQDSTSTFTISGLEPVTTYYLYSDLGRLQELHTDEEGTVAFIQDISKPCAIWIQPQPSTLYLKTLNSVTGWFDHTNQMVPGTIATYNTTTRTAQFTSDVTQSVFIQLNNVTINGNGHRITGTDYSGVGINTSNNNVTLQNFIISGFSYGIQATGDSTIIEGCTFLDNSYSLSMNNTSTTVPAPMIIRNNTFTIPAGKQGFSVYNRPTIISGNTFSGAGLSTPICLYIIPKGRYVLVDNNTFTGFNEAIRCYGYAGELTPVVIAHNTITNSQMGINPYGADGLSILENTIEFNNQGIFAVSTTNSTIQGNTLSANATGCLLYPGCTNTLIYRNYISSTTTGLYIFNSAVNNSIYNNAFNKSAGSNVYFTASSTAPSIWNYGSIGGNWWSDHQTATPFNLDIRNTFNIDNEPHVFTWEGMHQFPSPDSDAPVTTSTISVVPDGANGWFRQPVTVSLTANDATSQIVRTVCLAATPTSFSSAYYSGPVTFTKNGKNNVTFYSTDIYGNVEDAQRIECNIDNVTPYINSSVYPNGRVTNGWCDGLVQVNASCSDPVPGSGLQQWGYSINDGSSITISRADTIFQFWNEGAFTITFSGIDVAGNEVAVSKDVKIDKTAPVPTLPMLPEIYGAHVTITEAPTAMDNLAGLITGTTSNPLEYSVEGTYTIVWTYDDLHGKVSTQNQTVRIVNDVTPPAFTIDPLPDAVGECEVTVTPPTATDDYLGAVTATTTSPLTYTAQGTYTIVWTYSDKINTSVQEQTVIVKDITPPAFTSLPSDIKVEATGPHMNISVGSATAIDNCSDATVTSNVPATFGVGTTPVTFTATDAVGNTTQATITVTVTDKTAPVAPHLEAIQSECSYNITSAPVAIDIVDGSVSGTTSSPLAITGLGQHPIVWTFTDNNGNSSTAEQVVTIVDNTAPEFTTVPENITIEATGLHTPVSIPAAIATDNCGSVTVTSNAPATFSLGETIVIFTATDLAGNIRLATITVTVTDNTAPAAPLIDAISSECSFTATAPVATDIVDGTIIGTTSSPLTITGLGQHTIVWTFTDNIGNSVTAEQLVTIVDNTAPEFTSVPSDITVEATGIHTAVAIASAAATDNCGSVTVTSNAPATFGLGATTVTFTAVDHAGNATQATITVTVSDNTAPVVPAIDAVSSECSFTATAPTATDIVDGTIIGTTSSPLTITGLGQHTIVWTFTDKSGNSVTAEQLVTIVDNTVPEFTSVPEDIFVEATGTQTAVTLASAAATDNCGSVTVTSNAPATFGLGATTVTFTATDLAGNVTQATITITVTDKTAPVAPVILPVTSECTYSITDVPVATDIVDGSITGTTTSDLAVTGLGSHTIIWTFTDNSGNTSTVEQVATIVDNTAPQFTSVPADITVEATGLQTPVSIAAAIATDNCGSATVTSNAPATFGIGATTVTFTATDIAGNVTQATVTVTVTDNTAPVAPVILPGTSECSYSITNVPVATDIVDGSITGTTTSDLTVTGLGSHTIVWKFTDNNGNTSTAGQVVTIVDNTAPEFTSVPADITIEATGAQTEVTVATAVAEDNCGSVTVTSNAPATFGIGATIVTFTATDIAGNATQAMVTITVTDNTAPVAPALSAVNSECSYMITMTPVATDLVDGDIEGSTPSGIVPFEITELGEHTVVWNFTDYNGNSTTAEQTITIVDNTAPEFTSVPDAITIEATGPTTIVAIEPATAQDNCGSVTITSNAQESYTVGTSTVTFTATDPAGNTTLATMQITVTDATAPVAPVVAPVEQECSYTITAAPMAIDLVDGAIPGTSTSGSLPITISGRGEHTIVWRFTDTHGNHSEMQQVINIVDRTPPRFTTIPAPITKEATGPQTPITIGSAVAVDNCGTATVGSNASASYPVGIHSVTFTATDAAGNVTTALVTITITDTKAPVAPYVPAVSGSCFYTFASAPVAQDIVSGAVAGVADAGPLPFTVTGYGDHTVRWTFTDAHGNSSFVDQTVSIRMNAKVYMFDEGLIESNITKPRFYIQNNGKDNISNFKVEYYFRSENGFAPVVENYYTPNATISLVNLGYQYYKVVFRYSSTTLRPGQIFPSTSGSVIGIHYPKYEPLDKTNDYSNNLSGTFKENSNICVYTAEGRLISGNPLFINAEPIAFAGENISVIDQNEDGEIITLNAAGSHDPDGKIVSFAWYVNNSLVSQDSSYSLPLSKGIYTIRLVVTDNKGLTGADTIAAVVNVPGANLSFTINTNPIPANTPVTLSYEIPASMAGAKVRALLERTWDVLPWDLPGTAGSHQLTIWDWNRYFFGDKGPWTIKFEVNGAVVDSKQISFSY